MPPIVLLCVRHGCCLTPMRPLFSVFWFSPFCIPSQASSVTVIHHIEHCIKKQIRQTQKNPDTHNLYIYIYIYTYYRSISISWAAQHPARPAGPLLIIIIIIAPDETTPPTPTTTGTRKKAATSPTDPKSSTGANGATRTKKPVRKRYVMQQSAKGIVGH